jgi:hypothetical protein
MLIPARDIAPIINKLQKNLRTKLIELLKADLLTYFGKIFPRKHFSELVDAHDELINAIYKTLAVLNDQKSTQDPQILVQLYKNIQNKLLYLMQLCELAYDNFQNKIINQPFIDFND